MSGRGAEGTGIRPAVGRLARLAGDLRRACLGPWGRVIIVAGVIGVLMAMSGGFGARDRPFLARLIYCETLMMAGVGLGVFAARRLIPRPWFETRALIAITLMTLAIGLPMCLIAAAALAWMQRLPLDLARLADVFPTTLATTAGVVVLAFLARSRDAAETHSAAQGAPPARFLARLPPRLAGGTLWAVQAEDHYLRLRTSLGEDLILMRLADAVAELEGIEGARVHRSWWVARAAVIGVERGDGRATLILADGARAPVSRSYLKPLRDAGWLSPLAGDG